jgi:hypothetical protein
MILGLPLTVMIVWKRTEQSVGPINSASLG